MSNHSLILQVPGMADLDLCGENVANGVAFTVNTYGDDADWGNPVPITSAVPQWLVQGAAVAVEGYDNREMSIRVVVGGADSFAMTTGAAELAMRCGQPCTLVWTPPDEGLIAPATVFDVESLFLDHDFDDLAEAARFDQVFGVKVTARPFTRSLLSVLESVPTPSAPLTPVVVDNGNSVTPSGATWSVSAYYAKEDGSGTRSGLNFAASIASTSGAVVGTLGSVTAPPAGYGPINPTLELRRAGGIHPGSGYPYLVVDMGMTGWSEYQITIDGVSTGWLMSANTTGTSTTVYLYVPNGCSDFRIVGKVARSGGTFSVSEIRAVSTLPGSGSQVTAAFDVAGSAPTSGSLLVAADQTGGAVNLGSTMVYTTTDPNQALPPLSPFFSAGTRTTDATASSGYRTTINSTVTRFRLPLAAIRPGAHAIFGRGNGATSAQTIFISAYVDGAFDQAKQTSLVFNPTGADSRVQFPTMLLPPTRTPDGSGAYLNVEITSTGTWNMDDLWLFNMDTGELTVGAFAAKNLWLDAPDSAHPLPALFTGDVRGNAVYNAKSADIWAGAHRITPPCVRVYAQAEAPASLALTYFPRWHTYAAT